MITSQAVILMVGKIAVALASIVAISAGMSYYHSFTYKKKVNVNLNTMQRASTRKGGIFDDEN